MAYNVIKIADCYQDQKHRNGPACAFGRAIINLAINLVSMMKGMPDIIKAGKFHAIGESQGGSAHNAKNNTNVVYCGILNEMLGKLTYTLMTSSSSTLDFTTTYLNGSMKILEYHLPKSDMTLYVVMKTSSS